MISDDLLYKVAMAYYIHNKSQAEIAQNIGVSRVQVSKYLDMARKREIVRFVVSMPSVSKDESRGYQEFFKEKFGLKQLVVTPSSGSSERLYDLLAAGAMDYILKNIPNKPMTIGLGWGDTLYHLAKTKITEAERKTKWLVVPLSGGVAEINDKAFNINIITQSFAENVGASYHSIYVPFLQDSKYIKKMIQENKLYKSMMDYWDSLDAMIVSIGYYNTRSPIFRETNKFNQLLIDMGKQGIIGDIQSHFFTKTGEIIEYDFSKDIFNISLEQVRRTRQKIFIAGGLHKVESIIGALRMKDMVDVLITDKTTVMNIMECLQDQENGKL